MPESGKTPDQLYLDPPPEHSPGRRKQRYLIISALLVLVILALGAGWKILASHAGQNTARTAVTQGSAPGSVRFFGNNIPRVGCSQAKDVAQDRALLGSSASKYLCYRGSFSVDSEKLTYVSIQLTPAFEQTIKDKCTLDCGSSPGDTPAETVNVGTFIITANGTIENYVGFGGGGLESLLSDLTGCGGNYGILDKLNNGKLVIDNGRLGSLSGFSGLKVADNFGDSCTVDLALVSYLTTRSSGDWKLTDSVSIKKLAVHYAIQDVASCNNTSVPSARQACYTAQATLRNDTNVCENLASPTPKPMLNPGFDNCIMAVAKRSRNPQICDQIRYYRAQYLTQCQDDANSYKSVLKNDITTM